MTNIATQAFYICRNAEKTDNEKNAFKVLLTRKLTLELPSTVKSLIQALKIASR